MKVVPDTNVWIGWFRSGEMARTWAGRQRPLVLVSSIVLQELWAGVRHDAEARDLDRVYRLALRHGALLTPPAAAWILAGQVLARLRSRRSVAAARLRGLRNDVLLAASAFLAGAAVMTRDRSDFELIREELGVVTVE